MKKSKIPPFVSEKAILVTGAGGSIGFAAVQALMAFEPSHLVLLDHSERSLNEIVTKLVTSGEAPQITIVLGSVTDAALLVELFRKYRPQIVFHAAAFKHVPLMETNPLAAVQNNAIASYVLAKACRENSVSNLVLVSTDKAVNPISIMGASKRVAELALLQVGDSNTRMTAIRLGNVLSTDGSVVPLFLDQIRHGGPVTVTDPNASRYFLTLDEAVELIFLALAEDSSDIFIPRVDAPVNIREMAHELIKNCMSENRTDIEMKFIGLRPGDKLTEQFLYPYERAEATKDPRLLKVVCGARRSYSFDSDIELLSVRVKERDVAGTVEAIRRLVPEYQPTDELIRLSQELTA